MLAKIFLSLVGLLYLGLAAWCTLDPVKTSNKVGFQLKPGAGQSEFLTVYGGLEFAMALVFLLPWIRSDSLEFSLLACLLIHASLVVFRTASFFIYRGIEGTTINLAIGEWVIFIISIIVWFLRDGSN